MAPSTARFIGGASLCHALFASPRAVVKPSKFTPCLAGGAVVAVRSVRLGRTQRDLPLLWGPHGLWRCGGSWSARRLQPCSHTHRASAAAALVAASTLRPGAIDRHWRRCADHAVQAPSSTSSPAADGMQEAVAAETPLAGSRAEHPRGKVPVASSSGSDGERIEAQHGAEQQQQQEQADEQQEQQQHLAEQLEISVERRVVPLLEFSDDTCPICLEDYTPEDPGAPTVCK